MVVDYAGHPFQYDLSSELGARGHTVLHTYSASTRSPHARFGPTSGVTVRPVSLGRPFERYRPLRRIRDEISYGLRTAKLAQGFRPDRLLTSNVPVVSLGILWVWSAMTRTRLTLWLQDIQSGLARLVAGEETMVSRSLRALEYALMRRASSIVAISDEFADELARIGIDVDRIVVIENWAPLGELPERQRNNEWSARHGLDDHFVFLYSGTLGKKHAPSLLKALASAFADDPTTEVVVVAEGAGAEWLAEQEAPVPRQLPLQPFEVLPEVLASADCLIVLLDPSAGGFSVPSKTLTYLCAGRPILAAVPEANAAARVISERARSGLVVDPADESAFLDAAHRIRSDPVTTYGIAARAYAEREFQRAGIADRFEGALAITTPKDG